jgi:hypothetical protein
VAEAFRAVASASASLGALHVYLDRSSTAKRVELGLYAGSKKPRRRLGRCVVSSPRRGWNACRLQASVRVVRRSAYWLALLQPRGASGTLRFRDKGKGSPASYRSSSSSLRSLPRSYRIGKRFRSGPASLYADAGGGTAGALGDRNVGGVGGVADGASQCPDLPGRATSVGCPGGTAPTRSLNCSPSRGDTMTNTVSHLCGFPDTTNTGPVPGTVPRRVPEDITSPDATTGRGWHWDALNQVLVADTPGAVVQSVDTGNISITADGVLVQDSRLEVAHDGMGVEIRHAQNAVVQRNLIFGDVGPNRMLVGVKDVYSDAFGTRVTANNIYGWSTGVQIYRGLIADNYIHDPGYQAGDHLNGTTSNGFGEPLTIRHNTVFNSYGQTDAISLFEDFGTEANRVIDGNLVAGGGYCIYGGQNAGGPAAHDIAITNNHFSRMYFPGCGGYGPVAAWPLRGPGGVFTGNVWDDTGRPVQ